MIKARKSFSRIVLIGLKHYVSYKGMSRSDMTGNAKLLSTEVTVLNDSTVVDSLTTGCNKQAEVSNHNCKGSTLMQRSDVQATL